MGPVFAPYVRRPPEPSASAGGRSDRETANRRTTTDRVCAPAGRGGGDVADLWPRARTALAASWVARRGRRCGELIGGEDMCLDFALCVQRLPAPTARAGGRRYRNAAHRQPHGDAVAGVGRGDRSRPDEAVARVGGGGRGLYNMSGERRAARTRAAAAAHEHQVRRPPRATPSLTVAAAQQQVWRPPLPHSPNKRGGRRAALQPHVLRPPLSNNTCDGRSATPVYTAAAAQHQDVRRPRCNNTRGRCRPAPCPDATTGAAAAVQQHQGRRPQRNDKCGGRRA